MGLAGKKYDKLISSSLHHVLFVAVSLFVDVASGLALGIRLESGLGAWKPRLGPLHVLLPSIKDVILQIIFQ